MIPNPSARRVRFQTLKQSYQDICAGDDPWLPLGNLLHQFFGYYKEYRTELVREPIEIPEEASLELRRWAAFCAAAAEYLCKKYALPVPAWVMDERYTLAVAWFDDLSPDVLEVQEELRETSPEEFTRRNVFCGSGDDLFRNKYEYEGRRQIA